jgi:ATP-dependent exoDNAse (exonuclease V) alpha subunit
MRSEAVVHQAIALDYVKAAADPTSGQVVALAATRAQVAALNTAIRGELQRRKALKGEPLVVDVKGSAREFAVGDIVIVTRNHRALDVHNGTRGQVTAVDLHDGSLVMTDVDGQAHHFDRAWLARGDLDHGYALTVHKAQGITVDLALVNGITALSKEAGYVALSRGRTANHVYTTTDDLKTAGTRLGAGRERDQLFTAVDHLQAQLERRLAQRLASDHRPRLTARPLEPVLQPDLPATRGLFR